MTEGYHIVLYRQAGALKRWRWRRIAANGQITDDPGQAYATKWNAWRSAHKSHPDDPITTEQ